ncbi:methyl-accepting chemotaxis sensory transducer [Alicyclobacillus hesperidum URH17-3-68]|nr:methyl-accepting chemotaxis sensory transducer [Alicyclobacillus hesperidum URH17-3-68]
MTVTWFVNWEFHAQIVWAGHQSDSRLWIFAQRFIDLCHVANVVL